jgi:exodeoxyribonuclease-5
MDLSPQQQGAVDGVRAWLAAGTQQVYRLFGYAGTGKTTLAIHLAELMGLERVLFAAFTGKAALVMQKKGCLGARTIHSLAYTPQSKSAARIRELEAQIASADDPDRARDLREALRRERIAHNRPAFSLNPCSDIKGADLLIIDEVSMVGERMGIDLLSFGTPILVLGDPAQLPPVGDGDYFTGRKPDTMLTEIHRQAQGSPVVALATSVRNGDTLALGEYGQSQVVQRGSLRTSDLAAHDQVICGRNATRRRINRMFRTLHKETEALPQPGERLVCLRNNHDLGLLNGGQWTVEESCPKGSGIVGLRLRDEDRIVICDAHTEHFLGQEIPIGMSRAEHFDFGYALTCHKAQGSQWDSVVVVDESDCFRAHSRRWLYTAITRAADRVTVIQ